MGWGRSVRWAACAGLDLREDGGGDMWPMLAVVGPVLGDGKVGMFVDPDGKTSPWTIRNGRPFDWGDGTPVASANAPVAVLTGGMTASAGEAVAIAFRGRPQTRSFGEDTLGVPTGNKAHCLSASDAGRRAADHVTNGMESSSKEARCWDCWASTTSWTTAPASRTDRYAMPSGL